MAKGISFDILAVDKASQTIGKIGHGLSGLGKTMVGVGAVAGVGIGAVGAALAAGVKDAAKYQDLAARTASVIKSTGDAAHVSVKGIQAQASALESLSGVDEEVIINGENVLLTFTNVQNQVGKGNDIFNQATKSALDMSTALGEDLQSANIQLGKALNDPIKGITALSRVGVSFTEQQKSQIATMVKAGDTMGAQKVILAELNKEFGGAAKAAGSGFNGSMARLKDAFGDAMRTIGTLLLPALTKLTDWFAKTANKVLPEVIGGFQAFFDAFKAGDGDITSSGFPGFMERVGYVARQVFDYFKTSVLPVLKELGRFVVGTVVPALGKLAGFFVANVLPVVKAFANFVIKSVVPAVEKLAHLFVTQVLPAFKTFARAVADWVVPILKAIFTIFAEKIIPAFMKAAQSVIPAIRDTFKSFSKTLEDHKGFVDKIIAVFKVLGAFVADILIPVIAQIARTILTVLRPAFSFIVEVLENVVFPALKFLVGAVLTVFGAIIHGAAAAFGWVLGIGDKLKAARTAFDKFRDDVNKALNGISDKDVKVTAHVVTVGGLQGTAPTGVSKIGTVGRAFAAGGDVPDGDFTVGEAGFEIMRKSGSRVSVLSNSQSRTALSGMGRTVTAVTGGDTYNITVNGALDPVAVARQIEQIIVKHGRNNGRKPNEF